jgi:hypothetical protein
MQKWRHFDRLYHDGKQFWYNENEDPPGPHDALIFHDLPDVDINAFDGPHDIPEDSTKGLLQNFIRPNNKEYGNTVTNF